ncbi:hypothetical protein ASF20_09880 [Methylobacterium sp. Leaf88]|nr:hypothetical protein ASF20_09880 [Methylobacterium sp. Leaf88]
MVGPEDSGSGRTFFARTVTTAPSAMTIFRPLAMTACAPLATLRPPMVERCRRTAPTATLRSRRVTMASAASPSTVTPRARSAYRRMAWSVTRARTEWGLARMASRGPDAEATGQADEQVAVVQRHGDGPWGGRESVREQDQFG